MKKMEIHELGRLFEAVQLGAVLEDGKTFPDCISKRPLEQIKEAYQQRKDQSGFQLKPFLFENFDLPPAYSAGFRSDTTQPATAHIELVWDVLTRQPDGEKSSLIPLPYPYIVPGGRFREIYYWDSYFTMLGLRASGKIEMIQSMVNNFSWLIDNIGYIPNGNRTYFLGRSQPPFYSLMVRLLSDELARQGNASEETTLTRYLPQLEMEYHFWMKDEENLDAIHRALHHVVLMPDGSILNRYWDEHDTPRPEAYREDVELAHQSSQDAPDLYRHLRAAAESGWDFSSRWFRDENDFASIHTTEIVPVDLNCLLQHLEETLSMAYHHAGQHSAASLYQKKATSRKAAILKYCWDNTSQYFYDYDFVQRQMKNQQTLAALFPLFFGIAGNEQANSVANRVASAFLKPGGLTTTLLKTGQQWDAPNGWAPLQWISYQGLARYGFDELASEVKKRWTSTNQKVYLQTGKMTEKYDVWNADGAASGGEYPNQDGFGWTNGVFLAMQHG